MNKNKNAFTLIELLMVIAIIGILAGILIPTVGLVKQRATIATSKTKLSQYLTAIQSFKGEYKYYPFANLVDSTGYLDLSTTENSKAFYEALMARDIEDASLSVAVEGNRRRIQYYSFTRDELEEDTIIDGFGNNKIIIAFDHDNDGEIVVPDPDGSGAETIELRTSLTAFVVANNNLDSPAYYLYE